MESKVLCGCCALERGLSRAERVTLANSFQPYTVYRCYDCRIYLYYDNLRWNKSFDFVFIQSLADRDLKSPVVM